MSLDVLETLAETPWVQCPSIESINHLITNINVTNYVRGEGTARKRLDYLENIYRKWISEIIDLSDFSYCYFVNGVTDAINQWVATEDRPWQFLKGDYKYPLLIDPSGKEVEKINSNDVLYISNPACATGNFIDIPNIENPVILDCAYLGSTRKLKVKIPKNTEQVWFSFSKGWGLIGQRSGLVFSKEPHKSLDIMKNVEAWNYTSVEICIKIVENYDIDTTHNMLRAMQLEICKKYNLIPSDCFYVATSADEKYAARQRIPGISRLSLTNLFTL